MYLHFHLLPPPIPTAFSWICYDAQCWISLLKIPEIWSTLTCMGGGPLQNPKFWGNLVKNKVTGSHHYFPKKSTHQKWNMNRNHPIPHEQYSILYNRSIYVVLMILSRGLLEVNDFSTNSMEQCSSWEADIHSSSQEITNILWNAKVHYSYP
jgi:hypothetical protein